MNEHPGWRQGHWEAEESGEKKLCKQLRVHSRCWFEAGKVNKSCREQSNSREAWTMEAGIVSKIGLFV